MAFQKLSTTLGILLLLVGLTVSTTVHSKEPALALETLAEWQFHSIVDVKFVMDHTTMPMLENVMLIDARPYKPKYVNGHIPGAVSIPDSQFNKNTALLPADKQSLIIYYCGGLACKLSHKSARKAEKLGYTNVKVFARGYPEWKKVHGIAPTIAVKAGEVEGSMDIEMFKKNLAHAPDAMMIVDVRDKDEFDRGSFNNAVHIPVDDLEEKIHDLPRDRPVIFICSTGARSGEAYYMVQDLRPSLKNAYYLEAACAFKTDGSFELKTTEG